MKPKTFLRTLLFLPYLILICAVPFIGMRSDSTFLFMIGMGFIVYTIGILVWVITSQIRFSLVDFFGLVWYSLVALTAIFIYGNALIFFAKGIYKAFEHFKIIKNEEEIS